jgi:hypothetical protein
MAADGALEQKLAAWVKAQEFWAQAMSKYQGDMVPRVVTSASGGQAAGNGNAIADFMSLMTARTASELALDAKIGRVPAK